MYAIRSYYALRIAFDSWKLRDVYETAIRLAAKNGIKNMSNYLLYNYKELPVELYRRMKLNVDLCEELDVSIYVITSYSIHYTKLYDTDNIIFLVYMLAF